MNITPTSNINFGWNITTHLAITELALEDFTELLPKQKRWTARSSQLPDLTKVLIRQKHIFMKHSMKHISICLK